MGYKIVFRTLSGRKKPDEQVDADEYQDNGEWIDFIKRGGPRGSGDKVQVLRVRAAEVNRVEKT